MFDLEVTQSQRCCTFGDLGPSIFGYASAVPKGALVFPGGQFTATNYFLRLPKNSFYGPPWNTKTTAAACKIMAHDFRVCEFPGDRVGRYRIRRLRPWRSPKGIQTWGNLQRNFLWNPKVRESEYLCTRFPVTDAGRRVRRCLQREYPSTLVPGCTRSGGEFCAANTSNSNTARTRVVGRPGTSIQAPPDTRPGGGKSNTNADFPHLPGQPC